MVRFGFKSLKSYYAKLLIRYPCEECIEGLSFHVTYFATLLSQVLCNHFVVSKCEPLIAPHYVTCNLNAMGAASGSGIWTISGEEMEEVKAFKYLGVWFDRGMVGGNLQLEKIGKV